MELVVFIGIPASGKSTFYLQKFADTHLRINRDMLNTQNRETKLFEFCLKYSQPCVIDNTNVTREVRRRFITAALEANFSITGYFFESKTTPCLERNNARSGTSKVPDVAIFSKSSQLELPNLAEGFSKLHFVRATCDGFEISDWDLG